MTCEPRATGRGRIRPWLDQEGVLVQGTPGGPDLPLAGSEDTPALGSPHAWAQAGPAAFGDAAWWLNQAHVPSLCPEQLLLILKVEPGAADGGGRVSPSPLLVTLAAGSGHCGDMGALALACPCLAHGAFGTWPHPETPRWDELVTQPSVLRWARSCWVSWEESGGWIH